ncbi:hypothetical protein SteCoe_18724 [Stentor coeruleus]|uniref:Uncharacterized protein n=1 Tax=Stentor coeruleus TaxID=5963 RepID=A0A1R2BWF3_9CILI|nr:hypothetical protein SteCoe_18724 [Stentor coeruleus]
MVSLTYHDEHVAWQQRVQKEIGQAHRFQSSHTDSFKKSTSPIRRPNRSSKRHRAHSTVYSTLPAANINLGAMNVYAEVRGKYSRNANNTINNVVQSSGIVSRPTTSGSLTNYNRRAYLNEETTKQEPKVQEEPKNQRPLNNESKIVVKKRRTREKNSDKKCNEDRLVIEDRKDSEEDEEEGKE